jgi:uncharacterized protein DUF3592
MLQPRQFSLKYLLGIITCSAVGLAAIRYLVVSGRIEQLLAWIEAAVLICVTGLLALMGGVWLLQAIWQTLFWPKAPAKIMRYWIKPSKGDSDGHRFYHPVLRFGLADGRLVTAISGFGWWGRPWPQGKTVTVHYDPQDPRTAEIESFWVVWGLPIAFLGLAGGTLLLWFGGFWFS